MNSKSAQDDLSAQDILMMDKQEIDQKVEELAIEIKKDIRCKFLNMANDNRDGYNISLKCALNWISVPYTETSAFIKRFDYTYLRSFARDFKGARFQMAVDEIDRGCDYIYKKNENRLCIPYFSARGFKKLCLTLKGAKTNLVIEYFLDLEDQFMKILKMDSSAK